MILGSRLLEFRGPQEVFTTQFPRWLSIDVIELTQTITSSPTLQVQVTGCLHCGGHLANLADRQIIEGEGEAGDGMGLVDLVVVQIGSHHQSENGIPCLLGRHAPQNRTGEKVFVDLAHRRRGAGNRLVGLGVVYYTLKLAQIEVDVDHDSTQVFQKLGIGSKGEIIKVIDGFLDRDPKVSFPQTIGYAGGEARVLAVRKPGSKAGSQAGWSLGVDAIGRTILLPIFPHDEGRLHLAARLDVVVNIVLGEGEFLAGQGMHSGHVLSHRHDNFLLGQVRRLEFVAHFPGVAIAHVGGTEEGGQLKKLTLSPLGKGMVMALGARNVGCQEDGQGVGQIVERHTGITQQVASGTGGGQAALGSQHIGDHLVPRSVEVDLVLKPTLVIIIIETLDAILVAKQVAQPVEEMGAVAVGNKQVVDESGPLPGVLALDEGKGFLVGRYPTRDVEVDPTNEHVVTGGSIQSLSGLFQAEPEVVVYPGSRLGYVGIAQSQLEVGRNPWLIGDFSKWRQFTGDHFLVLFLALPTLRLAVFVPFPSGQLGRQSLGCGIEAG